MSKKADATKLEDTIYTPGKITLARLILLFVFFTIIIILSNLSLGSKIVGQFETLLNGTPACPITHKGVEFSWFMPELTIKSPSFPPTCFNRRKGPPLRLQNLPIALNFPSVYPFGLKLHSTIKPEKNNSVINLYPILGLGSHYLRVTDTTIDGALLGQLIGKDLIDGKIQVESNIQFDSTGPLAGDLLIKSKDVQIKSQSIEGLTIPSLPINNLQVKANLTKTKLNLISLVLGDEQSPLYANLSGNIRLNKYNITNSKLELSGEIRFSPELISSFPAINFFLSGKESQGGLYRIEVGGTLGAPSPKFL